MKLWIGALASLLCCAATAQVLPADSFGQLPMVAQPEISPGGQHVASILNSEQGPTIVVSKFGAADLTPIVRLKYGRDRIDWIRWANDDRLLISVSEALNIAGEKYRVSRLYQVGRDGKGMKQIWRKPTREVPWWVNLFDTNNIVSMLPDEPNHILLQLYDERDEAPAVFKVDLRRNKFKKLFVNEYEVDAWYANRKGEVVLGWQMDEDEMTTWYLPEGSSKWEPLKTRRAFEDETFSVVGIVGDTAYVITDYETGRQALWKYDITTGDYTEMVYAVDGYDLDDPIISAEDGRLLGVGWYSDYYEQHYFDEDAARDAALIRQSFPQHRTSVRSRSADGKRLMVLAVRDNAPPQYIWLDLETKAGSAWYAPYPKLNGVPLPEVTPIEFEARDGKRITGYLTLPTVANGDKPPLIVHPHGGPHARDTKYFDPLVQFFANRGYAVLQVNFRGSSGFGSGFEAAGYRQWGQAMQQDVYDGMDWLVGEGLVDADRKCIVGGSYGGYVALTAAFQRPGDFRCVASIAGIADLYEMADKDSLNPSRKPYVAKAIGNPYDDADRDMLKAHSAVNHLDRIAAPLLLIHGTEDTRVRVTQSRDFYRAAQQAGIDIEYLELEDGTHFLDEYNNRLAVFEALDSFLQKHL